MTARDMVERARRKQAKAAGVRTSIRMSSDMLAHASVCAKEVDETLADWVNKVCRQYKRGVFDGVAYDEKTLLATRAASIPTHVRAPRGMPPDQIKEAVARGIAFCAARRITWKLDIPARYLMAKSEE